MATRNDDALIAQQAELARTETRTCLRCGVPFAVDRDDPYRKCFRCTYPQAAPAVDGETWDELMAAVDAVRAASRDILLRDGPLTGHQRHGLRNAAERLRKAQGAAYAAFRSASAVCVNCKRPFGGGGGDIRCLECRGQ